ncbi:hypothetical protein DV702_15250 [Sporosarcina sp. PTS2304]|uniref:hypothetical protein n=1 Tax=Sporosarcina sp. PTS2304 TaxID=2283194 RepID=UPI000E0DB7FF|nr:hypothetical protein [Sporosarcina sp. PTS2304]AXI00947.1 hypothetical protein DV702_15250 [Sporosarcina sp. PTS2304]
MTSYYFIASDQKLGCGNASLEILETEPWIISGFDYPIQREIMNGVEKEWQLRELLQYIRNHTAPYEACTVQIAHLVNSNHEELHVQRKSNLLLHEINTPKQLIVPEGHLLTIIKVPISS